RGRWPAGLTPAVRGPARRARPAPSPRRRRARRPRRRARRAGPSRRRPPARPRRPTPGGAPGPAGRGGARPGRPSRGARAGAGGVAPGAGAAAARGRALPLLAPELPVTLLPVEEEGLPEGPELAANRSERLVALASVDEPGDGLLVVPGPVLLETLPASGGE